MTPIEFQVSMSKVKVTVTFKLRGIHVPQTFQVITSCNTVFVITGSTVGSTGVVVIVTSLASYSSTVVDFPSSAAILSAEFFIIN